MSDKERKYATAKHPSIEALVHGLYRYKEKKQALDRLKQIRTHFVLSKEQPPSTADDPKLLLWIKGFEVTPEEEQQGYTGHFALVSITTIKSGIFTLKAEKQVTPVQSHPQKKRLQSKHPNWGHPVMRAVKKQKLYKTIEAANAELELLHTEFPEVSIPGQGKLFIIIYEKREGIAKPTHKIALEIQAQTGGGFRITHRENEKTAVPKVSAPVKTVLAQDDIKTPEFSMPGHFASVEAVRKLNKRRRAPTVGTVEVTENDTGKFGATEKERKKRKKKKKKPTAVKEVVTTDEGESIKLTKFRESELLREQTRRRRTTIFDVRRAENRDKPE